MVYFSQIPMCREENIVKLTDLEKLLSTLPPSFDPTDPAQRSEYLLQAGLDPSSLYQELEMSSRFVDTHQDISYANTGINLHSHDFYELLYCCNTCDVEYLVGAERYRLQRGDIVLVPPGVSHRPLLPERMTEPYKRIVLWINAEFIDHLLKIFPETGASRKAQSVLLRTTGTRWEFLGDFFSNGLKESQMNHSQQQMLLVGNTLTLLGYIRCAFSDLSVQPMQAEKPELLDQVLSYIEDNLSGKISLAGAAHQLYVSQSTISQLFRRKMGVSFYRCVTQRRLISAKTLITDGLPLEDVAEQVGFTDYSVFYRAFKQEYGISPRQYRKLQEENEANAL